MSGVIFKPVPAFPRDCIVVRGPTPHVRRLGREVRGGLSIIEAAFRAHLAQPAIEYENLFSAPPSLTTAQPPEENDMATKNPIPATPKDHKKPAPKGKGKKY